MSKNRKRLYEIIFEADTPAGKVFDEVLLGIILFSVLVVMLESVSNMRMRFPHGLRIIECIITVIFTAEYVTRICVVDRPFKYILSFYGLIDLLAILPTYLGLFFTGAQTLIVIRALRLLRIFRILKLSRYTRAGSLIVKALWDSREKLSVFLFFVLTFTAIVGTLMYLIEGEENGFTSIPTSIYWAIVTLTTVGYGDLSPVTGLGKLLSSIVMIMGYAIIAVPTGIVTASFVSDYQKRNTQVCSECMFDNHDDDAVFCKKCGTKLYVTDNKRL